MYWKMKVSPPNKAYYMGRCRTLRRHLKYEKMPTIVVVAACWDVIRQAFGSDARALRWILMGMVQKGWYDLKERARVNWHMYVRLRTHEEIIEIYDRYLEDVTGEDHREWPSVVIDEKEFQGKS